MSHCAGSPRHKWHDAQQDPFSLKHETGHRAIFEPKGARLFLDRSLLPQLKSREQAVESWQASKYRRFQVLSLKKTCRACLLGKMETISSEKSHSASLKHRSRSREFRAVEQADTPFHSLLQHSVIRWTTDAVEYRPNDSGVESDDGSLSLIQTGVQRRLRQQGLSSAVDPHVFDRWCVKQSEESPGGTPASDSDLNPGSVSTSPLSRSVTVPRLICLDSSLSSLCPWRQSIAEATFRSEEVAKLRDGLLSIRPWPAAAFSNDWTAIPDAHEYVSLISSFQPSVAETGEYHIFLDGSFIPSTFVGAWAFSIVLRTVDGGYFR